MDRPPRLLTWNYSLEEKECLDTKLQEWGAPPAVSIRSDQAHLTLHEIIHTDAGGDQEFHSEEKVLLFYNIPDKGVFFLINQFSRLPLPRAIYAVVTEHSIRWTFSKLLEHLIEERNAREKR